MSFTDEDGNKCACSRNRQCAFHRAQTKKLERVAQPLHDAQKVQMGIEELRRRYAKPKPSPSPRDFVGRPVPRKTGGWSR